MSYDTDKVTPGAQRIDVVQIDLGKCLRVYGVAPCTASGAAGTECVNSWESCQDAANYSETATYLTPSLCTPVSALPVGAGLIPFLKSVEFDPGDITPEDGVGKVGSVAIKCMDAPHDDVGIDPYVSTRTTSALTRGTFWPRLRARWPHYQGRNLRWYTGYVHTPFSLSNLRCRHYVVENLSGFGGKEGVTIKAKDPLQLADDKRSQFPKKSTGTLLTAMTDVSSHSTLDISTSNATEYDLYPFEAISCVAMKDEVVQYTGTTIITGGVRLTGVTRSAPSPYVTTAQAHDIGDDVQKCAWWDDMSPPTILGYLLELGAAVPSAWIPVSTWETLYTTWLGSQTMTRLVVRPLGVSKQSSEILQQSNSWGLWWDEVEQEFGYEVFRPAALGESVPVIDDDGSIGKGSLKLADDTDNLINDCVFYNGQIDPTKDDNDEANYLYAPNVIDAASVDSKEVGAYRTRKIYGTWHAATPAATIRRIAERLITARASVPFVVTLELNRKDDDISTGDFIDLTTAGVRNLHGEAKTIRMRVVKADYSGTNVKYTARQDFISDRFGLIAPDSLSGLTWADATDEQRLTYVFIANNAGYYSDGTPGKRIF